MAVKHLIGCGIGFSPGGPRYIVSRGLSFVPVAPLNANVITIGMGLHPKIVLRGFGPRNYSDEPVLVTFSGGLLDGVVFGGGLA